MATPEIGSPVTLTNGEAGTVYQKAHYLDGQHWRVRIKDADGGTRWKMAIVPEAAIATVSATPTHDVGDRVQIGPEGPSATVTAIISGSPTLYQVAWTYYTPETRMPIPQIGEYEAWQLV